MINDFIKQIRDQLTEIFREVDNWFDVNEALLNHRPANGGWTIGEVLEHISLINFFLLILIRKGTRKALEQSRHTDFTPLLVNYYIDSVKLDQVGEHKSFEWNRPAHMEPTGTEELLMIRDRLNRQLDECHGYLAELKNGEGVLFKTTMTVNGLGKIDVYHYMYFLVQHAKRHVAQMKKIGDELNAC